MFPYAATFILTVIAAICVLCQRGVSASAASCQDTDTGACVLLHRQNQAICSDPALNSVCMRFCGLCPLSCYHCPTPVSDPRGCSAVMSCAANQTCLLKRLSSSTDGHNEYIMMCGERKVCDGFGNGFLVGKRSQQSRDVSISCCDTDLCNTPVSMTTSIPTLPPSTQPSTAAPIQPSQPGNGCIRDIVLVIDESSTVGLDDFGFMRDFIESLFYRIHIGENYNRVALLGFSSDSRVEWYLNEHYSRSALIADLYSLGYVHGSTHTELAFKMVRTDVLVQANGDRPNVPNDVILITDGRSTAQDETVKEIQLLHSASSDVIVVGVSDDDRYVAEWEAIATDVHHVIQVDDYPDIDDALDRLVKLLCV